MDLQTRKKISRTMKGKSNFEGHKHTHATKIQIGISQEGHKNAKNHKWSVDKETGKETRVKGNLLPKGNRWGRTRAFSQWIHAKEETEVNDNEQQIDQQNVEQTQLTRAEWIAQLALQDKEHRAQEVQKANVVSFKNFKNS